MHYALTTLPNGLRVITESMTSVRSVAIGVWVDTGSRDERSEEAGCSHFLEHLLFKGSDTWSAKQISDVFDGMGAQNNAFTSKEYTCYWARMRDEDLPVGVDILGEMIQRPAFRQNEIDSERHVVLEEINMNDDDPTDVAYEQFTSTLWKEHPLAPPILGTKDSILGMSRDTIAGYWGRRYAPEGSVVAIAGHIDHEEVVALVTAAMGEWRGQDDVGRSRAEAIGHSSVGLTERDTEQAHLVFGGLALARDDKRRFALSVADHILGGGMSSRLFREIREQRGLAYSVHSYRMPFSDTGAFAVYVGTTPNQTDEVLELVRTELKKMIDEPVTDDELTRAKGHVKGSLALATEDANSRMMRLGRNELTGIEHLSVDEIVARVESVTAEDILDVAADAYSGPYVLGATGPFDISALQPHVN